MDNVVNQLLHSDDPSIRYRTLVDVLGKPAESAEAKEARAAIPSSERVQRMLSLRREDGRIPGSPYAKFTGAHWTVALLADLGYPPGDTSLLPLRDQVFTLWLSPSHTREFECKTKASCYGRGGGVPILQGRARRCGSQEGYALYAALTLGLADERVGQLAANLIRWQWPDGGWNCDRTPEAVNSSFHETQWPLRALALYARVTGDAEAKEAADRAAEVFLKRKLYKRVRDGKVIHPAFTKLCYPGYWHYDFLAGLKVMAEGGYIGDARCQDALDLLESKRLPDGGFPAEKKYYKVGDTPGGSVSLVDWGGTSARTMNPFVTVDALYVLRMAGRG
jgi:hypothetical protein